MMLAALLALGQLVVPAEVRGEVAEFVTVIASTEGKERLNAMGITATVGSPEKFSEQIKFDLTRFAAIVKNANIKAE